MSKIRSFLWMGSATILAACGGDSGTPPPTYNGPPALGIVSGQNQIATAGDERLSNPIIGRLVRTVSGEVAWVPTLGARLLDGIVPRALAQDPSVLKGSPIVGAVVCAISITEGSLVAFTPCTNTDSDGKATFFFSPGTLAGVQMSEIRGTLEGKPMVFDTAMALVKPGPVAFANIGGATIYTNSSIAMRDRMSRVRDQYQNPITDALPTIVDAGGYIVRGDTIYTSSTERTGQVVVQLGELQKTVTVHSVLNLAGMYVRAKCGRDGWITDPSTHQRVNFDTLWIDGRIDSLGLDSVESPRLFWTGTIRYLPRGMSTPITLAWSDASQVVQQTPGQLYFGANIDPRATSEARVTKTSNFPVQYAGGGGVCRQNTWDMSAPYSTMEISATPF